MSNYDDKRAEMLARLNRPEDCICDIEFTEGGLGPLRVDFSGDPHCPAHSPKTAAELKRLEKK